MALAFRGNRRYRRVVPRALRYDKPGTWHHVMQRGARREPTFRRDEHCILFLLSVDEAVEHHGLEVHAYSLMPNHYHLLVRSPLGNLSRCMKHINATYTQRLNLRHGWDGPVFRGRFRSQVVEAEEYLDHVFTYIHLNPFRAGLATRLDESCWTSLRAYLGKERPPSWLSMGFFNARFGGSAGVEEAVRSRRKRPDAWPEELDRETGWIRPRERGSNERQLSERRPPPAQRPIDDVLRQVASVVGCSVAAVRKREMGRAANPARRFAVWALSRAHRSHREIALALGMSEGHVAKVLWSFRQEPPGPELLDWMTAIAEWQKV